MRFKEGTVARLLIENLKESESKLELASLGPSPRNEHLWRPILDESQGSRTSERFSEHGAMDRWYQREIGWIETYLRGALAVPDIAAELRNDRYWHVIGMIERDDPDERASLTGSFEPLCLYQAAWLRQLREQLEALVRFDPDDELLVVPDTNVFAHCGTVYDIDWSSYAGATAVHLVVPHVVIDELDDLKRTARDKDVRLRVRFAINALKKALSGTEPGSAAIVRDGLTVAVLPDPPGHQRLPSNDEEICDRAHMLQQFAYFPSHVLLASNDMGMHVRAHAFGLDVIEIPDQQAP